MKIITRFLVAALFVAGRMQGNHESPWELPHGRQGKCGKEKASPPPLFKAASQGRFF